MKILILLAALQVKHFVVDFPLQTPYQYLNKGKYGHPGGILHSALQSAATILVLSLLYFRDLSVVANIVAYVALDEFLIHYHTDWAKVQLNQKFKLDPSKAGFWNLFGIDQATHQLFYLWIAAQFI